jgi:Tol biopolymer transport system component
MRAGHVGNRWRSRRYGGILLIPLLMLLLAAPVAAQDASPEASPSASPEVTEGGAGWRVVDTRRLAVDGEPVALAPDGQWVAGLSSEREFCVWEIETLDATCDGGELPIRPETIVWAPDSSAVAFALEAARFLIDSDIYVFEVEDGELVNLTDDGVEEIDLLGGDEDDEPLLIDDAPGWSPDSQSLVFARTRWAPEGRHSTALVRVERAGGETDTLFSVAITYPFAVFFPVLWLEDDRLLYSVFLPDNDDTQNGLYIAGVDASGVRQVLPGDSAADVPGPWVTDITPDGRVATVYSRLNQGQFGGEGDIYFLLDLETEELTPITTGNEPEVRVQLPPSLSPDGETLLFTVISGGQILLAVQDVASGEQALLAGEIEHRGITVASRGFDWAANDTVLIPFDDESRLLTLERTD